MRDYFRFERPPRAIYALDGLRGIAVLLVLLRHAAFPVAEASQAPVWQIAGLDLAVPLINGWIGVDLFFVLSGFLIASHLLRDSQGSRRFRWRRYIVQRFLRIMPTYWFVLAIVAAGVVPLFAVDPRFLDIRVAYHALLLQDYLPPNIVVAFWSLGVEEKFYLLAPLLVGMVVSLRSRDRGLALLGVIVLLVVLSRSVMALQADADMSYPAFLPVFRYPFHHCLDTLVIGMIAALLYRSAAADHGARIARWADGLAWGGLGLVLWLLCGGELLATIGWWDMTLQPTLIGLAFGSAVLGAALGGGPQRLLCSTPLLVTARVSYPLYLIHMALIPLCWALVGATPAEGGGALLAFLPVYLAVSFVVSVAIHFLVEKPFLILKDRLARDDRLRGATAAT